MTGVTSTVTVAVSVNVPSDTVYSNMASPSNSSAGVNTTSPFASRATEPFVALPTEVIVSVSPSTSESFSSSPLAGIVTGVSSGVAASSSAASGTWLNGVASSVASGVGSTLPSVTCVESPSPSGLAMDALDSSEPASSWFVTPPAFASA